MYVCVISRSKHAYHDTRCNVCSYEYLFLCVCVLLFFFFFFLAVVVVMLCVCVLFFLFCMCIDNNVHNVVVFRIPVW